VYTTKPTAELGGPVYRAARAGGTSVQVAPAGIVFFVSHHGDDFFFSRAGTAAAMFADGTLYRVPAGSGDAELIVESQFNPLGVAADSGRVYWANFGDVTHVDPAGVYAYDFATMSTLPIAPAIGRSGGLVIDETAIYFTVAPSPSSGSDSIAIRKVAK
jgi:hypothetical protein